jgi:hypothetical protein
MAQSRVEPNQHPLVGNRPPQKFGERTSTPRPLQPLEIPQNRQRNLWKNLEKKGLDLEMLGEKAWRFGAPPRHGKFEGKIFPFANY